MNVPPIHVTDADIDQFRRRQLSAADLVTFADHLAGCDECRRRVANGVDIAAASRSLQEAAGISGDDHVEESELQLFVDGGLGPERRREVSLHLDRCASCAAEVRDLQSFVAGLGRPGQSSRTRAYAVLAAAAVLVLAVGVTWQWRTQQPHAAVTNGSSPSTLDLETLTPADRARVREALDGRLELQSPVLELNGQRGTLLGSSNPPVFRLSAPVGTVVIEDRPTLRWTPLPGAVTYIVTLQDQATGETISSAPLTSIEWTVERPLPRGRTYAWQVAGSVSGGSETVTPTPPDPPAKFKVLDAQDADRLGRLPSSHLVRGVLYADAGLLDDAERELMAVPAQDPGSRVADRLLKQIRGFRP